MHIYIYICTHMSAPPSPLPATFPSLPFPAPLP